MTTPTRLKAEGDASLRSVGQRRLRIWSKNMERGTGIEPATSSLGSWHSTAELPPLLSSY